MTPRLLSPKFNEALAYAAELHAVQARKGTNIPYVSHLLGVASLVLEHGGTEVEATAALLHDALEDQGRDGKTEQEIESRFGPEVLAIVKGCTDAETVPKPPWRARKEAYIAHIASASVSTRLVSASDKLHNARAILDDLRALGDALWERFNAGRESIWYYRSLVTAFQKADAEGGHARLVGELDRTVTEIERLASGPPA